VNVLLFAGLTLRELVRRRLVAAVGVLTFLIVAFTAWGMHRLATAVVDGAPLAEPAVRATAAGIVIMLAFLFSFVVALGAALVGELLLALPDPRFTFLESRGRRSRPERDGMNRNRACRWLRGLRRRRTHGRTSRRDRRSG